MIPFALRFASALTWTCMLYVWLESLDLQNYLEHSHRRSWSRKKSDPYYRDQILIVFFSA